MGPDNIIDLARERRRRGPRFDGGLMDILEVSRDLVCLCRKGCIAAINGAGARMLGAKSADELIGRKLADFMIPEYGPMMDLFLSGKASEDKAVPTRLVGIDHMTCDVVMQVYRARELAPDAAVVVCRDASEEGRLEAQAQETDARFALLVENAMNMVCHVRAGIIRYVNRAGKAMLGTDIESTVIGKPIAGIFHEDYAGVFEGDLLESFLAEGGGMPMRLKRPDGQCVDAMVAVTRLPSHGAEELMVEARDLGAVNRAVTALRRANETLEMRVVQRTRELAEQRALAEERKQIADAARHFSETVLDAIPSPVWFKDARGHFQSCNRAFRELFGRDPARQPESRAVVSDAMPPQCAATDAEILSGLTSVATFEGVVAAPGGDVDALLSKCALHDEEGHTVGVIGVISDITERKAMERELRRLATTDPLTGMDNRRQFMDISRGEVERAARYGHPISVLMLDIDHFKRVNDTHGHAVGDDALKALTAICMDNLRDCDRLGRLGGEEFAMLLPETPTSGAAEVAERLRKAMANIRMALPQGGVLGFTVSIGVATRMDTDSDLDSMLARADEALYRAKQAGRNRVDLG